jgi:diguanylate cyclase (GGDEF)-like protein
VTVLFFADTEQVNALEARRAPTEPDAPATVELAWYLRQADTARAIELAADAVAALPVDAPASLRSQVLGRAALVRAEAAILQSRLSDAEEALRDASSFFDKDAIGRGDVMLVQALLESARGAPARALALDDRAAAAFAEAAPAAPERVDVARAYGAFTSVYADPASLRERLDALADGHGSSVAAVLVGVTRSLDRFNKGEHAEAIAALEPLARDAEQLGMIQLRLRLGNTIAAAYSNLDDKEGAISWVEASLERAREAGWPVGIGEALAFLGNFYREAGQFARALETLTEARNVLQAAPRSRGYALACCYLAHVHLAAGAPSLAVERAAEAEDVAMSISATPIAVDMLTVAARATARMGDPNAAVALVQRALAIAREQKLGVWEVDALRALAELYSEHRLPPPDGVQPSEAPLHFLRQAQEVVRDLTGHAEGVAISRELARAHEVAGDFVQALAAERAALTALISEDAQRISNRLLAVEARHQTEKQRMEVAHQRRLAASEAARAEALARAYDELEYTNRELRAAQAELERLANTDVLTGIANRRHFLAFARNELERALRYGRPVGFVMTDIDKFKSINDTLGHPCGDQVIISAARVLDAGRRSVDGIGRFGGEEFALLLPETDLATALAAAERLRASIERHAIEWEGKRVPITMSFGVAVVDAQQIISEHRSDVSQALDALIQRADAALYVAKTSGRNRVSG